MYILEVATEDVPTHYFFFLYLNPDIFGPKFKSSRVL